MAARRARTYYLYRQAKTKTLNITIAIVMVLSSLGGALPLILSQAASAAPPPPKQTAAPTITSPIGPVTIYTNTATITGTVSDSSLFTIRLYTNNTCTGVPLISQDKVAGSNTFSVTPSTLINTTYNFYVTAQKHGDDLASGCVTVPTITRSTLVVLDTTPPSVPTGGQPSGGIYLHSNAFDYTWNISTDNSGGHVTYEYQTSNVSCTTNPDGTLANVTWSSTANGSATQKAALLAGPSIPSEGTGDGTWCWQVRAVDPSNNKSAWSAVWSFTLDSQAPTTPTLLTPPNNSFETTNDFYFTWTDSSDSGSPVTYQYYASQNPHTTGGVLDTGVWDNLTSGNPEQNNLTTPKIHSTGAPDGDWYWQVRALDAAGNKSGWTGVWKVTIDTQTPGVPTAIFTADNTNASVPNGGSTNSQFFTFHLSSASDTTRYQLKYWNTIPGSPFNGEANAWNPTDLSAYSPTLGTYKDNFTQGEGTHYFAFSACDGAGNCSAYSAPFVVTYDKTAPTGLAHVSPSDGTVTTTANQALIDWTDATDPHGPVTYYYESSNSPAINGDGSFVSPVYQSGTLTESQIPTLGTPEGVYYWHVRAVDSLGNSTPWTTAWKLTVDNTAPATPTLTFPADGVYRHSANTNHSDWSTVTDPNGPITYYYESAFDLAFTNIAFGPHALTANTILNPGEPEGTYYWRVQACDAANNCSDWSAPRTIHIDNTAPVVSINSYGQALKVIQPNVTATDASPLTYLWTPSDPNVVVSNVLALNPTFTVNADGTYTFIITATDAAGNSANASFTFTYTTPVVLATPAFTGTTTTTGGNPPAPITDNGTGTTTPQVLGDSTVKPSDVKGDSTVNTQNVGTTKGGKFLFLGWWWLAILAALFALFLLFGRRRKQED